MSTTGIREIGEGSQFYGYIIGLQVDRVSDMDMFSTGEMPCGVYVTFEYSGKVTVWKVPDLELYRLLSAHLESMVFERLEVGGYGMEKLWIEKVEGRWRVELP